MRGSKFRRARVLSLAVAGVAFANGVTAWANTELDVLNGATDLTSAGSYVQGTAPTTSSDVTFQGSTYSPTNFTLNSSLSIGTLNDLDSTDTLSISNTSGTADTLTLNGGGDSVLGGPNSADLLYVASGGTLNIVGSSGQLGLNLAATGNLDVLGAANISAVISGSKGLTFTGGGTLTLGAVNTYTGTTLVNGGTLVLAGGTNTLVSTGTLKFGANSTLDLGGGAQTISLFQGGSSTNSVNVTVQNGTLTVSNATNGTDFNASFYGTLNIAANATFNAATNAKLDIRNKATLNSAGTVNAPGGATYSMLIGDGAGNDGTVNMTGGAFNLAKGTATGQGQLDIGSVGTGVLNVSGGTFSLLSDQIFEIGGRASANPGNGTVNISGSGVVSVFTGTTNTSIILGGGTNSFGTVNLGNYSTSGQMGGTLVTGRGFTLVANSTANVNFDGGTFQATGNIGSLYAANIKGNVLDGGLVMDLGGHNVTISQPLNGTGSGGVTLKSTGGGGIFTLSGNNTYVGPTQINAGTLLANTSAFVGSATGSGTVTVNSGAILAGGSAATPGGINASGSNNGVIVNSGATISAGNGVAANSATGLLMTNGGDGNATFGQVWNAGGQYTWKVNPAAQTSNAAGNYNGVGTTEIETGNIINPGTNWDMLGISSLDIPSTFTINIVPLGNGTVTSGAYTWSIADITSGNVTIGGTQYNSSNLSALQSALQAALTLNNTTGLSGTEHFSIGVIPDAASGEDIVLTATAQVNTELDVKNGSSDLTVAPSYIQNQTPTAASDVVFLAGTTYNPVSFTINSNLAMGTLNDLDNTQALTISNTAGTPSTLTLAGGANSVANGPTPTDLLYVPSGGTLNISGSSGNLGLVLASAGNLDVAGAANISAVISGTSGLTFTGGGTLSLGAANTYTGTTSIGGGTLVLAGGTNTLNTSGTILFANDATLDLGGGAQTIAGFKAGSASGNVTATVQDGTLTITGQGNGSDFQNSFFGTLNLAANATLNTGATNKLDVRQGGTMNSAGTVNAVGNGNALSLLVGDGTAGTLNITGGSFNVATGEAATTAQVSIGSAAAGTVTITGGAFNLNSDQIFEIGGRSNANPGTGLMTVTGTGAVNVFTGTANTGIILGGGANSSGTFNLGTYSTNNGQLGGTLTTARGFTAVAGSAATVNFDGGTFGATGNISNFIGPAVVADVRTGGAIFDLNGFNVGLSQHLVADPSYPNGGVTLENNPTANGGTLTLAGTNTFTGGLSVPQTTRVIASNQQALGTGPVNLNGGTLQLAVNGGGASLSGFTNFQLNGGPTVSGSTMTITTAANNLDRSAFYKTPVAFNETNGFNASFTYQDTSGNAGNPADGIAFVLQNDSRGAAALGAGGGALGYGAGNPILNSGAIEINIYNPVVRGTTFGYNGSIPANINTVAAANVDPSSGDPIQVTLVYNGQNDTLTETMTDTTTSASFNTTYTGVDFTSLLNGHTGYVGFTGATGGANANQTISNFSFSSTGLTAQVFANAINVSADSTIDVTGGLPATVGPVNIGGNTLTVTSDTNSAAPFSLSSGPVTLGGNATFNVTNSAGGGIGTFTPGPIGGGYGVTYSGPGTVALNANSSYTGPTLITGGIVLANSPVTPAAGSSTGRGPVTVNGGALAGGSAATPGYIAGPSNVNAVTINSGGTISAGNGISATSTPGLLTTSGGDGATSFAHVWNAGGQYLFKVNPGAPTATSATQVKGVGTTELQNTVTPAGTNWDTLAMTSLSIPSTFTINVQPLSGGGTSNPAATYSWSVADVTSGNIRIGNQAYTSANLAALQPALRAAISVNGSALPGTYSVGAIPDGGVGEDIVVNYAPVPEPTSLALAGVAAGALMMRRRRKPVLAS